MSFHTRLGRTYYSADARATALVQGLNALNWHEGSNLRIDWRWAGGDTALYERLWVLVWMLGAFYLGQHASVLVQAARHIRVVGGLAAAAAVVAALFALWRWRRASRQAL
jgi:hypothetical protein